MTMYELDPDVVRWGLQHLDCSFTNDGSPQTVTCYANDYCRTESVNEGFIMGNDEVITSALQEEFEKIAAAESSGYGGLYQRESILSQNWLGPPGQHFNSGFEQPNLDSANSNFHSNQEAGSTSDAVLHEAEEMRVDNEEKGAPPEIEDDPSLDGEVGRRMNQLLPLPHVPKTNGEIPSAYEATSDHERLLNRLELYELVELKISGDGNCQFRSLSDQIYRSSEHHKFVREQVVNQLNSQPELYANYVPMAYGDYMKKMSKNGEWGDHVTLQAAADWYGIKIFVITSFKDTCYIEILPQSQKSERTIFLSFWAEVHYNSIYPLGELPPVEIKKKRRWWQ